MLSLYKLIKVSLFSLVLLMVSCDSMSQLKKYTVSHIPYKGVPRIATTDSIDKNSVQNLSYYSLNNISVELKQSVILALVPLNGKSLLALTRQKGLHVINVKTHKSRRIDRGLPPEVIYPFKDKKTKPIENFFISKNRKRIVIIMPPHVCLSEDGGRSFKTLPLRGKSRWAEFMSVALHPTNKKLILLGTSARGLYFSLDKGRRAYKLKGGVPGEPHKRPNFREEVRSLIFTGKGNEFYAGFGNGGGIYKGSISKRRIWPLKRKELFTYPDGDYYRIMSLSLHNKNLFAATDRGKRYIIDVKDSSRHPQKPVAENILSKLKGTAGLYGPETEIVYQRYVLPGRDFSPNPIVKGKRAMYISYTFTQGKNYKRLISLLRELKLNAVIINLKDDHGVIRVPCDDPIVKKVPKNVRPYVNLKETIDKLHRDGIYIIGRQVVFKDKRLYHYKGGKYAVKSRLSGRPLRKGPEKWVDAHSEFTWDYNIAVAKAIEKLGIDEIQYDYIRFPDVRGGKEKRKYDFAKPHQTMREALASFLIKSREHIKAPVSIDLFGYNAVYKLGNWIGQDIQLLSRYVDAICPMFYPSHYTGGFAAHYGKKRIYYIIKISCKRAKELTKGVHHRPYIQAFRYKTNWDKYSPPYIGWQLDGLKDSGIKDYIFWNNLVHFKTWIRGMRLYQGKGATLPRNVRKMIPKKKRFESVLEKWQK